jgi:hypothetical protein
MYKCTSEKLAQSLAKDFGLSYGWSVFGGWFVGTAEQLGKIGVTTPSLKVG